MKIGGITKIQVSVESEKAKSSRASLPYFSPQFSPFPMNSFLHWMAVSLVTIQCDMSCAAAVMA